LARPTNVSDAIRGSSAARAFGAPVLVAAVLLTAAALRDASADADTAQFDVNATLSSTVTVVVQDTLDCGDIASITVDHCEDTGARIGSLVDVEAFGSDAATITLNGPVEMQGPGASFNLVVNAYPDASGTGAPIANLTLSNVGEAQFYLFPDGISGLTATTLVGIYFGTGQVTVTTQ